VYLQKYDDAVKFVEIANGLNPYNALFLNGLGTTYLFAGDYKKAEKVLKESLSLSTSFLEPLFHLVQLYAVWEHWEEYYEYFTKLSLQPDASPESFQELGDFHLSRRDFRKAAEAYRVALQKGLDSTYVNQLTEKHPQLLQYLFQQIGSPDSPDDNH